MKQKEVFKKIGSIIKELNDQYEYLQTTNDELNDLELELFVSNAHFLADHIEILCKLNLQNRKNTIVNSAPVITEENIHEKRYFEPVVQQMRHGTGVTDFKVLKKPIEQEVKENKVEDTQSAPQIELERGSSEDTYSYIREEPEVIRHELILSEDEAWDEDEVNLDYQTDNPDKTPVATQTIEPVIEFHKVSELNLLDLDNRIETPAKKEESGVVTINQKISSQISFKSILKSEQLAIKPINDIKPAITLNDKLLYVKDLFKGYNLAYSEAIEILNRFNTFEEASRFLDTNYVIKNNWESKPATTEKFYALLKRRYA